MDSSSQWSGGSHYGNGEIKLMMYYWFHNGASLYLDSCECNLYLFLVYVYERIDVWNKEEATKQITSYSLIVR